MGRSRVGGGGGDSDGGQLNNEPEQATSKKRRKATKSALVRRHTGGERWEERGDWRRSTKSILLLLEKLFLLDQVFRHGGKSLRHKQVDSHSHQTEQVKP